MKKTSFALISLLLLFSILLNASGCASVRAADLMDGITPRNVEIGDGLGNRNADLTDFAVRLFKAANEGGENTLISPL